MQEWARRLSESSLADLVVTYYWSWPVLETLHFIGLCVLLGSLLVIDLRLLGLYRQLGAKTAERLAQVAILGFALNLITGIGFLAGNTWKYFNNSAFELKMLLILLAGINALIYQWKLEPLLAGDRITWLSRTVGLVSILLWCLVIICGRMITFFAPLSMVQVITP